VLEAAVKRERDSDVADLDTLATLPDPGPKRKGRTPIPNLGRAFSFLDPDRIGGILRAVNYDVERHVQYLIGIVENNEDKPNIQLKALKQLEGLVHKAAGLLLASGGVTSPADSARHGDLPVIPVKSQEIRTIANSVEEAVKELENGKNQKDPNDQRFENPTRDTEQENPNDQRPESPTNNPGKTEG